MNWVKRFHLHNQYSRTERAAKFGFLVILKGEPETEGDGDSFGGLRIITEKQEAEYRAAKKRRVLFEQHRKQTQLMIERHAQEEKKVTDDPELSLYRE